MKHKPAGFDRLAAEIRARDDYWVEHAKLGFSIGLGDLLDASGLSKADFARKLDASPAYVTKLFRGDVNFTIETMVRLVRALGGRLHLKVAPERAQYDFVAVPDHAIEARTRMRVPEEPGWTAHRNLAGLPTILRAQNDSSCNIAEAA